MMVVLKDRNMYENVDVVFNVNFKNVMKFNKECFCWCMDFIEICN